VGGRRADGRLRADHRWTVDGRRRGRRRARACAGVLADGARREPLDELGGGSETSASFSVSLQPTSTYTFQDGNGVLALAGEAGAGQASVSFTTSATTESELEANATATPQTTTTGAAPKLPPKPIGPLLLGLSRGGVLALTVAGKRVTTLPSGRYVLTVPGLGRLGALELRELGGATISLTSAGPGRKRSITLVPGNWTLLSHGHGSVRFIVEPAWAG
jgi:hypothetical protein